MRLLIAALALASTAVLGTAATALPIDEDYIDAIFSQPGAFGPTPFDMRFGPVQTLVAPEFVELEFDSELPGLFATQGDGPAINIFLVDRIFSRFFGVDIVGVTDFTQTGFDPRTGEVFGIWGNDIAFDKTDLSSPAASRAIAHELGHALGLFHEGDFVNPPENLMNLFASEDRLFPRQVTEMLASPWLQGDDSTGYFVEINVFDVRATPVPVPLPAGMALLIAALCPVGLLGLRGRARTTS